MPQLRSYQIAGVDKLVAKDAIYLQGECGIGKSAMALEYAKRVNAKKILWFTPATAKIAARAQANIFYPQAKCHMPAKPEHVGSLKCHGGRGVVIELVNPDKISRGSTFTDALVSNGPYDLLIADEAHNFRNAEANRTRALFERILPACNDSLFMSGTPVMNGAQDLYVPLRYLAPHLITDQNGKVMSRFAFEARYCTIENRRVGSRLVRVITGSKNLPELNKRIDGFFLPIRKAEVMDELPQMQWATVPLLLDGRALNASELKYLGDFIKDDMTDEEVLAAMRNADESMMSILAKLNYAKAAAAVPFLQDFLHDNPHRKILVWSTHIDSIDRLTSGLSDFKPAKIDGRDSDKIREAEIQKFLGDKECRVFVGSIKACSTGITLLNEHIQPQDNFFVSLSFTPSDNEQSASRIHRMGQRSAVLSRILTVENVALDVRVSEILARKQNEISEILK